MSSIVLNMIVKTSLYNFGNTPNLANSITFDYWVILTLAPQMERKPHLELFSEGIRELHKDEWQNFAHNRNLSQIMQEERETIF